MLKISKLTNECFIGLKNEKCRLGESKFWGAPDLPEDFDWPQDADGYDMDFICQINLGEIKNKSDNIPENGMLYFFGSMVEPLGFADEPKFTKGIQIPGYFSVKYSSSAVELLQSGEIVDEDGNPVGFEEIKMDFGDDDGICKKAFHQFGGEIPDDEGNEDLSEYSLLFCLDSFTGKDFTLEFENSGYMYFLVKKEDAKNGKFDNILCYLQ